jgi:outer membrane protein assembly factor BamB
MKTIPSRWVPHISGLAALLGLDLLPGAELFGSDRERSSKAPLAASSEPGWPQFRGPRRDGICDERELLPSWPEGGPKLLWSTTNLGRGFSSPSISAQRLFITGDVGEELHLFAFDLKGAPLWKATNGTAWKTPYPGARATPTYNDGRVYHENAHGRVACFDGNSGKEVWSVDLLQRFGGQNIEWALSECLLVDNRAVYATPGGREALMVALDKRTGDVLWKSKPLYDSEGEKPLEKASYASPILVEFADRRLLIGCSLRHLFCIDAENGALQWTRRMPTAYSVLAMMPVLVNDSVFMTAPHGKGGRLFRLLRQSAPAGSVDVEEVWNTQLDTCQGGVLHAEGKLFGSFYSGRKGWGAVDTKTGRVLYQAPEFVKGACIYADERLYTMSEDGWMRLLEPTDNEFKVHGQFRLTQAKASDAWAHPVIHNGRLYLRYHQTLYCFDIRTSL